ESAADDQQARRNLFATGRIAAGGVECQRSDARENGGGAPEHDPPQAGDFRGRGSGRVEGGHRPFAAGERSRRSGEEQPMADAEGNGFRRWGVDPPPGHYGSAERSDDTVREDAAMEQFAEPEQPGAPTHVAVIRHPLHPMLANFPIAFLVTVIASDLGYWYTGDPFWARTSLWLLGGGTVMGIVAGI